MHLAFSAWLRRILRLLVESLPSITLFHAKRRGLLDEQNTSYVPDCAVFGVEPDSLRNHW
jgi:hypothetical protein